MHTVCLDDPELAAIAERVRQSRRIVVVTGAGISCSAGIPDFRSKDGLYNLVKHEHPDAVVKGQDLFDAGLFRSRKTIGIFFTFIAALRAQMEAAEPTAAHRFLRHLDTQGKLLRVYTQNIDGFEARLGLKSKTVMLHGDIHLLRCTDCKHVQDWSESDKAALGQGKAPSCVSCKARNTSRRSSGLRKRATGVLRPHIVLYNEDHPAASSIGEMAAADAAQAPDLLLVMGTSLRVDGIKGLVRDFGKAVKRAGGACVFVNATPVASAWGAVFDFHVQAGIDEWVANLKQRLPSLWQSQSRLAPKRTTKPAAQPPKPAQPSKPAQPAQPAQISEPANPPGPCLAPLVLPLQPASQASALSTLEPAPDVFPKLNDNLFIFKC